MIAVQQPARSQRGSLAYCARSLWSIAPVWRFVVILASCLTSFAIVAPILANRPTPSALTTAVTPNAVEPTPAWNSCSPSKTNSLGSDGVGRVARILSAEEAVTSLRADEIRFRADIESKYLTYTRVEIKREIGGQQPNSSIVVVPWETVVRVGDTVEYRGAYMDPNMQCNYIPSLITHVIPAEGANSATRN